MGEDRGNHQERVARLRRRADELGVPLMNNTKWREVFLASIAARSRVGAKLVGGDDFDDEGRPPKLWMIHLFEDQVGIDGLRDPGFGGGPCAYWEIVEAHFDVASEEGGQRAKWREAFVAALLVLQIAHRIADERVIVYGYDPPR